MPNDTQLPIIYIFRTAVPVYYIVAWFGFFIEQTGSGDKDQNAHFMIPFVVGANKKETIFFLRSNKSHLIAEKTKNILRRKTNHFWMRKKKFSILAITKSRNDSNFIEFFNAINFTEIENFSLIFHLFQGKKKTFSSSPSLLRKEFPVRKVTQPVHCSFPVFDYYRINQ